MFGRKILFLVAWYVAGNVVASVYSWGKKKAKKVQWKEDMKLMVENFLDTQKNFVSDIEKKYISEENQEKLWEKKEQFMKHSEKYIKQWEKLLDELSKNEKIAAGKSKAGWFISDFVNKGKQFLSEIKEWEVKDTKKKK
jgi:hypothetical protein